jgi:hypothetical protein
MEEHLFSNLKVEGSRPACAKIFFRYTTGKFLGAENAAENSGTNSKILFCYMYESSLRHPVCAPEINVTAWNSVGNRTLFLLVAADSV